MKTTITKKYLRHMLGLNSYDYMVGTGSPVMIGLVIYIVAVCALLIIGGIAENVDMILGLLPFFILIFVVFIILSKRLWLSMLLTRHVSYMMCNIENIESIDGHGCYCRFLGRLVRMNELQYGALYSGIPCYVIFVDRVYMKFACYEYSNVGVGSKLPYEKGRLEPIVALPCDMYDLSDEFAVLGGSYADNP